MMHFLVPSYATVVQICNPKPFLNELVGKLVVVKLKWGMEYKGEGGIWLRVWCRRLERQTSQGRVRVAGPPRPIWTLILRRPARFG